MRILLINKFLYPKGGDAISTLTTGNILSSKGHEVIYWGMDHPDNPPSTIQKYLVSNVDYDDPNGTGHKIISAINILYSFDAKKKMTALIDLARPDVVHLNNFAHQISPSILNVIKKHHIPTIMTMHDYKMVCPSYSMLVNGKPCEKCRGGRFYYCGINRCTKQSLMKSLVNVIEMYLHHKILHIYDAIDLYVSPSRFLKNKVGEMGLNEEVIFLPNCIDVAEYKPMYEWQDQSIIYMGRLSQEKGVETLIDAVRDIQDLRLKIIGDGPLKSYLAEKVAEERINNVDFLGYKTGLTLHNMIRSAMFLVIPSQWYENNPRSVIESFALGKPIVGARIGGIPELVYEWKTGLTFNSGNASDLKEKICLMLKNKDKIPEMGKNARIFVEKKLNIDMHYQKLIKIYQLAIHKSALKQS